MMRSCSTCGKELKKPFFPGSRVATTIEEHLNVINNITPGGVHSVECSGQHTETWYKFEGEKPIPLYRIEVDLGSLGKGKAYTRLLESSVPKEIILLGHKYRLFAVTLFLEPITLTGIGHFIANFHTDDGYVLEYDGLKEGLRRVKAARSNASVTCAYYMLLY
jgi:hypothetical protein